MKRCSLTDRIYYYCYRFVLKTPSRDDPYVNTTQWVATVVFFHLAGLVAIATLKDIPRLHNGVLAIIVVSLLMIAFAGTNDYYISKKMVKGSLRSAQKYPEKRQALSLAA